MAYYLSMKIEIWYQSIKKAIIRSLLFAPYLIDF